MNKNTENYCKSYIESKTSPNFAIFLKGEWGCGKTHFINKILKKYDKKNKIIKENEIIYISLFGVSNTTEIDNRMYQALHPILSSKKLKYASAFLRTALKIGINFDLNEDGKKDGTVSLGRSNEEKEIKITKFKKKLIVVDDIERSKIEPSLIFGYFSEYITELNTKIIFVGNEEQISNTDEEKEIFHKIKEKIIGIEFTIKPEIENFEIRLDNS